MKRFKDRLSLNEGRKYCKMPQREHSAILSTFIKLPVVIKSFVMSIFEWSFYTRLTECEFEVSMQAKPFCVTITAESRVKTWLVL